MMHQTKVLETWVGLFVALGLIGVFFMAMKVSNLADLQIKDNSYRLIARFQNAGSLKERAVVSMAGVRIGRVSSIKFDKDAYEAVVEMRIDPEYNTIPDDTTANVLTAGLLGEQYVGLSPGGSQAFLKDGDKIELTQSALVLEEVISRFLFNKAEGGGSDKKESASMNSTGADTKPDTAVVKEPSSLPKTSGKKTEEGAAVHRLEQKLDKHGNLTEHSHEVNGRHAKAAQENGAVPKPKRPQTKTAGEEIDSGGKGKSALR